MSTEDIAAKVAESSILKLIRNLSVPVLLLIIGSQAQAWGAMQEKQIELDKRLSIVERAIIDGKAAREKFQDDVNRRLDRLGDQYQSMANSLATIAGKIEERG